MQITVGSACIAARNITATIAITLHPSPFSLHPSAFTLQPYPFSLQDYHSHNSNLTLGLFTLWDHCIVLLGQLCAPNSSSVTTVSPSLLWSLLWLKTQHACLTPVNLHHLLCSSSFCLDASAPFTVNRQTCYFAVSLSPSSVDEASGLMSCANHLSNDILALNVRLKWSHIAAHPWPIHEAMSDKGLMTGLIAHTAEHLCKSIGPDFELGHWSYFSSPLSSEQLSPTTTLTGYTCSQTLAQ